jgi:6-phosphogluconolactonase
MIVPDRGADKLYIYSVTGPASVEQIQIITLEPGTGPRHITYRVCSSSRTYMYLVSELDNTLRVFTLDGVDNEKGAAELGSANLEINQIQLLSTLGPWSNRTAPNDHNMADEVALSADGKFVYVANRDQTTLNSDVMSIYSVNPGYETNGPVEHLTFIGTSLLYGKIPRHFSLSKYGNSKYAAVALEVSNEIAIIERNETTGLLGQLRGNYTLGMFDRSTTLGPMAVIWD